MASKLGQLMVVAFSLSVLGGCKSEHATSEKTSEEGSQTAEEELAVVEANEASTEPTPPKSPPSLTPEQFKAELVPAVCSALVSCKNEDAVESYGSGIILSAGLLPLMALGAGFAEIRSAEMDLAMSLYDKERMEALGDRPEGDSLRFTQEECAFLLPPVLAVSAKHPDLITEPQKEGTIKYDGEKAKRCIDAISTPTPMCEREKEPDGGLKLKEGMSDDELGELWEAMYARLRDEWEPCFEVATGMLEEGAECTSTLECGGDLSCVSKKRDAPLTCQTETAGSKKAP